MALSYSDITSYAQSLVAIADRAKEELSSSLADAAFDATGYDFRRRARLAADKALRKHLDPARELGAQWYEYAADAAGVDVDPALMEEYGYEGWENRVDDILDSYDNGDLDFDAFDRKLQEAIENEIRNAAREEVIGNLDRDASNDRRAGRSERAGYARVPVGETCAWCFMLASLGYYYRSYESAGGLDPDHYHLHCDCVVVPYSGPDAIDGYDDYDKYLEMYERANEARKNGDYSDEMAQRIQAAKERHERDYAAGKVTQKWTPYNETLMLMREQNGLRH